MAINLELPRKLQAVVVKTHQGAAEMMRPIARKYDLKEHAYPIELDTLINLFEGAAGSFSFAGADALRDEDAGREHNHNGANMAAVLQTMEASWGDVAMMLSVPYQGLGNAAISAVATDEQLERLGKVWAAMAITEPGFGSDSAAVSTTATLDGDEYVINGEKIFVTAGSRATHIVVWATLDRSQGRAAIKSFIVPREHPGVTVERLEKKLGIKGSDTAVIRFDNARIPKENLLGNPEIEVGKGFSGVMETFDNTRPIVAGMAIGIGRAALLGHSMGGKVAMLTALLHPSEVDRLVIVDIAPAANPPNLLAYIRAMRAVDLRGVKRRAEVDVALAGVVPDPAERAFLLQNLVIDENAARWRLNLEAIERGFPQILGFPDLPVGAAYRGPALFVAGARSNYIQPEHEPGIRRLFPRARILRIEGAGHWVHAEQPQAFLQTVAPFLSGPA